MGMFKDVVCNWARDKPFWFGMTQLELQGSSCPPSFGIDQAGDMKSYPAG